jgi:hypothetical protein
MDKVLYIIKCYFHLHFYCNKCGRTALYSHFFKMDLLQYNLECYNILLLQCKNKTFIYLYILHISFLNVKHLQCINTPCRHPVFVPYLREGIQSFTTK